MKAFVTGATGFVGSHLADKLLESGFDVSCLIRETSNLRWLQNKNIKLIKGTLFDKDKLKNELKDSDYVFHSAGVVKAKNKQGYIRGNVEATKSLIEIAYEANPRLKKFIHISSQAVCGPNPDDNPIDENYKPKPITTYGATKLQAEEEVKKFKAKIPVNIIRPPAIFGPRDNEILIYFKTFQNGLNSIIGFGKKYLSLVYVEDLINGILLAAEKGIPGETYFICSDRAYDWDEISTVTSWILSKNPIKIKIPHWLVYTSGFFAEFFSLFSSKASTLNLEKCRDITRKNWVCSNAKAKRELGFIEEFTLEEGFRKTIEWYKEKKWLK
jgi:nucleoside-diphosphate-sugar epimerase